MAGSCLSRRSRPVSRRNGPRAMRVVAPIQRKALCPGCIMKNSAERVATGPGDRRNKDVTGRGTTPGRLSADSR